jgi:hypothetical protein
MRRQFLAPLFACIITVGNTLSPSFLEAADQKGVIIENGDQMGWDL